MKIVLSLALLALASCAHHQAQAPAKPAAAAATTEGAGPGPGKIDRSGTLEQQLARLQDAYDRNAESIDFLNRVYAQQKARGATGDDADDPAEDATFAVDVSGEVKAGQVDGPADAPVTIVKAFDFACPYCQRMVSVMEELVQEYDGKVRVVYANMVVHPPARPAHLASCAAAKQGKYRQFKDAFWDKGYGRYVASQGSDQAALGEDNILAIAKDLGLDTVRFKTDMSSRECEDRIASDMTELAKFHVNATPTFFINGKHLAGAMPKEAFKRIIDEQIKIVAASGVPAADYYAKVVIGKGEKQFRAKAKH